MRHSHTACRALLGLLLALAGVVVAAAPVAAHTELASSDPVDGATVDGPLIQVALTFTQPVEQVEGGFAVLDGDGTERTPAAVPSEDGATWTLVLDPPVAPGEVAVRWEVLASDGHPRSGGLVVTVLAADDGGAAGGAEAPSTTAPATPAPEAAAPVAEGPEVVSAEAAAFLDEGGASKGAHRVESLGRTLSLAGGLVAVGALAVTALVVRGDERDLLAGMVLVRRAAALAVLGGLVEVAARWSLDGLPDSGTGLATVLRLAGVLGLLVGSRVVARPVDEGGHALPVVGAPGVGVATVERAEADQRVDLRGSPWALAGGLALAGSFLLDGHTASEGVRAVTAAVDLVHVAAGAAWAGGVVLVAVVLRDRSRRRVPTRAAELGARFSVVATWAIVAAALAGVVLTASILDAPGDLVGTAWGRLLVLKVGLVAVAAGLGAHNHRTLVPALRAGEDGAGARFARALSVEAVVLVGVLVTTAWLVAADTTG